MTATRPPLYRRTRRTAEPPPARPELDRLVAAAVAGVDRLVADAAVGIAASATPVDPLGDGSMRGPDERPPLPPNPKQAYGDKKPNLALVPDTAVVYDALGFSDGAIKYGPFNWRITAVEARTYVAACKRHLDAWYDGEELSPLEEWTDPKTGQVLILGGKPHLAHARSCLAILIDAIETGNLIDNRPPKPRAGFGGVPGLIERWTGKLFSVKQPQG